MNNNVFESVADRTVTPLQAAEHLQAQDYFRRSWRVLWAVGGYS